MEWLLSNEEEANVSTLSDTNEATPSVTVENVEEKENTEAQEKDQSNTSDQEAKLIRCDDCGKLFRTETEIEFHAAKSGHSKFSESTEEKKPLTEDEKKEQLAKIEAKLKQRRLEREAREKEEQLEKEKNRIRSGKDLLEAKRKLEEAEMKKIMDQKKREKQEEKLARERVKQQIEQDRQARKTLYGQQAPQEPTPATSIPAPTKSPVSQNYSEVKLQIRLTNGTALTQTFGAKEPLSAVRLFVEINRTDEPGPFQLKVPFPAKVFGTEDYDKPLDLLGNLSILNILFV